MRISKMKRPRYRGNVGVRMENRTHILEGKGLGFSSCAAPFSTPGARFRRKTRKRTESERKSIGQTKLIFKLKSNYRHDLYLYKSKVLVGI